MRQRLDFQHDLVRRVGNLQDTALQRVAALGQQLAVHAQLDQFQRFTVEHDILVGAVLIARHRQARRNPGRDRIKIKTDIDRFNKKARRCVIFTVNRLRNVCTHG